MDGKTREYKGELRRGCSDAQMRKSYRSHTLLFLTYAFRLYVTNVTNITNFTNLINFFQI